MICASPYRRTLETAAIIAQKTGSPLYPAPLLQEYVRHDGKARIAVRSPEALKAEFPMLVDSGLSADWPVRGPETLLSVKRRAAAMLDAMKNKETGGGDWLFVTHGAVIKGFHLLCIGYEGGALPPLPMNWNCCLSEYEFGRDGKLKPVTLFDVSFLPEELVTSNERRKSPAK